MKTELQQKITEIETKLNEMRAQLAAMPDEPVTPVKWVPKVGKNYFYIDDGWAINTTHNAHGNRYDAARIARGNCYPTVSAAIDARDQQDFIREWLNAGDVPNESTGAVIAFENNKLEIRFPIRSYGVPKFSSIKKGREWVDSHGGPDVVRERLARGWV